MLLHHAGTGLTCGPAQVLLQISQWCNSCGLGGIVGLFLKPNLGFLEVWHIVACSICVDGLVAARGREVFCWTSTISKIKLNLINFKSLQSFQHKLFLLIKQKGIFLAGQLGRVVWGATVLIHQLCKEVVSPSSDPFRGLARPPWYVAETMS